MSVGFLTNITPPIPHCIQFNHVRHATILRNPIPERSRSPGPLTPILLFRLSGTSVVGSERARLYRRGIRASFTRQQQPRRPTNSEIQDILPHGERHKIRPLVFDSIRRGISRHTHTHTYTRFRTECKELALRCDRVEKRVMIFCESSRRNSREQRGIELSTHARARARPEERTV